MKANEARDCNSAAPWALKKLAFRMNDGQANFPGEESGCFLRGLGHVLHGYQALR